MVERVLLRPKRDLAGRVLLGPKRDVAGRVLLGPKRDVAGRVLLGPKRDVAGRVAVAEESRVRASCCEAQEGRGRGLSSWEEVAKKERETNEQHGGTVALVASPKERDDVESHQKTKVSRSIGAVCSLSRGHQL